MMKSMTALMLGMMLVVSIQAGELRKSGACTLRVAKTSFDEAAVFTVTVADETVEAFCDFRGGEFFDNFAVFAVPRITNRAGRPINVSYHVAFFDQAGDLIASTSQNSDLAADAQAHQLGSCLTQIPKAAFEQIAAYKLVIYTADTQKKN